MLSNPVYATFGQRIIAGFFDMIVLSVFLSAFLAVTGLDRMDPSSFLANALSGLALLSIWPYFAWMECSAWQGTLGKRIVGIRVAGTEGHRMSFLGASVRFFGKVLFCLPFFIGFFAVLFGKRNQALYDLAARSVVLDSRKST